MVAAFSAILTHLRQERELSQREAARDLGISQALLSHYENGLREPKLEFVVRVCDYYNVSADYLLGRTKENSVEAIKKLAERLQELSKDAETLSSFFLERKKEAKKEL